jgi:hypothetical protein
MIATVPIIQELIQDAMNFSRSNDGSPGAAPYLLFVLWRTWFYANALACSMSL